MVIEEIEEPPAEAEASPTPARPTPAKPTPAKPDAVRRIAIEEDSDDSADDDDVAADPKAPRPPIRPVRPKRPTPTDTRAADELKRRADDAFKRGDMDGAESLYTSCLESGAALGDEKMALAVRANRAAARLKLEKYPEAESDAGLIRRQGSEARQGDAQARRGAGPRWASTRAPSRTTPWSSAPFPGTKGWRRRLKSSRFSGGGLNAPGTRGARGQSPQRSARPGPRSPTRRIRPCPTSRARPWPSRSRRRSNAALQHQRAKYFSADELYTEAIGVATERRTKATLLANRAATRLKVGKHADAEMDASSAIECDGSYVKGYHRRAQARTNLGLFEPALEDFEHVVRATPDSKTLQAEVNACMQKAAEAMMRGMDLGGSVMSGGRRRRRRGAGVDEGRREEARRHPGGQRRFRRGR